MTVSHYVLRKSLKVWEVTPHYFRAEGLYGPAREGFCKLFDTHTEALRWIDTQIAEAEGSDNAHNDMG